MTSRIAFIRAKRRSRDEGARDGTHLRDNWPQALRDNGFDPAKPSAWIAEGLLIYLPASAQRELFTGIDALAAPGSHVGIEESVPLPTDLFAARVAQERAGGASASGGPFYQLVYNEQHAPAAPWFGSRGWRAEAVTLSEYLLANGRPTPAPDSDTAPMTSSIILVSAVKG